MCWAVHSTRCFFTLRCIYNPSIYSLEHLQSAQSHVPLHLNLLIGGHIHVLSLYMQQPFWTSALGALQATTYHH